MSGVSPCIWMNGEATAAADFYVGVFRQMGRAAEVLEKMPSSDLTPGAKFDVLTASFVLDGTEFMALNGGPEYQLSPAISFTVSCGDQAEVDGFWKLLVDGGREIQCGWLVDRFGVSWQIVPEVLPRMLMDPDKARADRVMRAMLQMVKLDIAALEQAYEGAGQT